MCDIHFSAVSKIHKRYYELCKTDEIMVRQHFIIVHLPHQLKHISLPHSTNANHIYIITFFCIAVPVSLSNIITKKTTILPTSSVLNKTKSICLKL